MEDGDNRLFSFCMFACLLLFAWFVYQRQCDSRTQERFRVEQRAYAQLQIHLTVEIRDYLSIICATQTDLRPEHRGGWARDS